MKKIKIGIIGASGFAGQELTALLAKDKYVEISFLQSASFNGRKCLYADIYYEDLSLKEMINKKPNVVFFCTPNGVAKENANLFLKEKIKVIDLSSDFRFENKKPKIAYGLTEIFAREIAKANLVANPGCYVTSILLPALPIKDKFKLAIFDCKSGYSGAGAEKAKELSKEIANNFYPYKIADHRHTPEIQQFFKQKIFFTPHLLPIFRGIVSTCHFILKKEFLDFDYFNFFKNYFKNSPYIKIQKEIPCISDIQNYNEAILGGFEIDQNGRLIIISALDNLRKGAVSQALDNMHLMFGLPNKIPDIFKTNFLQKNEISINT